MTDSRRRHHWGGLVWTLIRTDFKTRYHGTIGGFGWALLKPLAIFLVLLGVFSFVFRDEPNYPFHLIVGLFLYDFFSDATKTALVSLRVKGYLITKASFPSWIIVVTSISNAVLTLAVFAVIVLAFLVLGGHRLSLAGIALFFWYQIHLCLMVIAFGLASSVLFLKYRDLNQVWEVVVQAGFFVAPVIYPLGILPERLHVYLYIWPPTPMIMFSRAALIDGTIPSGLAHLLLTMETAVAFGLGMWVYARLAPKVAESL
ncbi:MAG: ABC transporter permease [Vicinamibacterales bacterium]